MKYEINVFTWFQQRELDFCPNHFTVTKTPLTVESKVWIEEKLIGRYAFIANTEDFINEIYPAFEDPKDAVLYELTWSN